MSKGKITQKQMAEILMQASMSERLNTELDAARLMFAVLLDRLGGEASITTDDINAYLKKELMIEREEKGANEQLFRLAPIPEDVKEKVKEQKKPKPKIII